MYKAEKIERFAMTTFLYLNNLETGTTDYCFDDSIISNRGTGDFDFMQEGGVYDCKIELFGDFDYNGKFDDTIEITVVDPFVLVGNTPFMKVLLGSDEYYVLEKDASGFDKSKKMLFNISRKDLIQVNDTIHGDCLRSSGVIAEPAASPGGFSPGDYKI